jgi:Putative transposase
VSFPGGGLSPDQTQWIRPQYPFFLPVKVLGKVFRGKFVQGLRLAFRRKSLTFVGPIQHLAEPKRFGAFLRTLFRQDWVVYAKPAFGGPEQVVRYLGRYTHRVAISNHRLLSFDGNNVTFRWRDYAHGNKQKTMTVSTDEFIRRFLLHVLPKGFVRIRHFGFMANSQRSASLELCRRLLGMPVPPTMEVASTSSARLCPTCHRAMIVVRRLKPAEIVWRFVSKSFSDTS